MKMAIGSDHAGVGLKKFLQDSIADVEFIDVGTDSEESCDYPDYIRLVAEKIQNGDADAGIAICGTGIGASLVANKHRGIRAALCTNEFMADMSRQHNNANVLVLGARVVGLDLALRIARTFIKSEFEGGRHQRRLDKLADIESNQ